MGRSTYRLYLGGAQADEIGLARVEELRVDLAVDMAAEARVMIPMGRDETGEWPVVLEDELGPESRVRVEVSVGDDAFVPIFDGRVAAQRFELSGGPNESRAIVVAQDESAFMNREDRVRLFQDMAPEDIAANVFAEAGLRPDTDSSGVGAPSLERMTMQRGTDFAFLRRLARASNMAVWVEPDDAQGTSVGLFKRMPIGSDRLPELLVTGRDRNVNRLVVEMDALAPVEAQAERIDPADLSVLSADADATGRELLGDVATSDFARRGVVFLASTAPDLSQVEAAAQGTVDRGAWAYSAEGETTTEIYPGLLRPYRVVPVAGAGGRLSGDWFVAEVSHVFTDHGHAQRFALRRNAHSGAGGGGLGGIV